ncbi:MAG: hypothetical protein RIR21_1146, partial [Pseudomonadota bacterium]
MHFDLRIVNIPSLVIIKFRPLPLCLLLLSFVIMISAGSVPGQANHLTGLMPPASPRASFKVNRPLR